MMDKRCGEDDHLNDTWAQWETFYYELAEPVDYKFCCICGQSHEDCKCEPPF